MYLHLQMFFENNDILTSIALAAIILLTEYDILKAKEEVGLTRSKHIQ